MMRMNRILGIHPEDGVAVVQPGVITRDLQEAAHAVGWDYPTSDTIAGPQAASAFVVSSSRCS